MNPVNLAEPWYSKGSSHKTTGREGSTTRGMNLMNLICGWVGGVLERGTRQVLPPTPLHLKKVQKVHWFIFRDHLLPNLYRLGVVTVCLSDTMTAETTFDSCRTARISPQARFCAGVRHE